MSEMADNTDLGVDVEPPVQTRAAAKRGLRAQRPKPEPVVHARQTDAVFDDILASPRNQRAGSQPAAKPNDAVAASEPLSDTERDVLGQKRPVSAPAISAGASGKRSTADLDAVEARAPVAEPLAMRSNDLRSASRSRAAADASSYESQASDSLGVGADLGSSARRGGDLSRSPMLADGSPLTCPFPRQALHHGVDSATVRLRVEVEADSHVDNVVVMDDPGDGFGQEALRCAMSKRWQAGLDRSGNATRRATVVSVRFSR